MGMVLCKRFVLGRAGPVELEQILLHHPAHQVRYFHLMHAVAESALESVAIEQREKELEILFPTVMRSCRHQKEMARQPRQQFPKVAALGVLNLADKDRSRELVGLVAYE